MTPWTNPAPPGSLPRRLNFFEFFRKQPFEVSNAVWNFKRFCFFVWNFKRRLKFQTTFWGLKKCDFFKRLCDDQNRAGLIPCVVLCRSERFGAPKRRRCNNRVVAKSVFWPSLPYSLVQPPYPSVEFPRRIKKSAKFRGKKTFFRISCCATNGCAKMHQAVFFGPANKSRTIANCGNGYEKNVFFSCEKSRLKFQTPFEISNGFDFRLKFQTPFEISSDFFFFVFFFLNVDVGRKNVPA